MRRYQPVAMLLALVALGAVGALVVAAALGMKASELAHLAGLLGPSIVVTVVAAMLASSLLRRTSLRQRYLAIAAVGTLVAMGNLLALAQAMFVSAHAATVLSVVLVYAGAAGLAAAFASARSSVAALDRVTQAAETIGSGDLSARVGSIDGGPELDRLASTLDEMARRLQDLRDQEQRVERIRRDLITAVSHDLRTPLSNLHAMTEAIDDGVVEDAPTVRRYASEMRRAVGRLSSLVDDLFDFVRVDDIRIDAETADLRLGALVASSIATVEMAADDKNIRLTVDISGVEEAPVSPHLERVLQNLLGNAVRHTPSGGTIHLEGRRRPLGVHISVQDSGEGIPGEHLPRVFDPFYRVDASRSGNGSGLGLALADRIVRALGGSIAVASRPGSGTRFDVHLPLRARAVDPSIEVPTD
ncbi:MAG TPA: HAMP domain-containing sensor histidine kinase [Actinomycetota bacterium]|nr:HAMP domain-containing sensor histidine kinase [Actinomycetota bacterium]